MLMAHQIIRRGIETDLPKLEARILEEMLIRNHLEMKLCSTDCIYNRSKELQKILVEQGYDLVVIKYEGGLWDGEEKIETISWKNAEEGRKGIIAYKRYAQKIGSTEYKEVPEI